MSKDMVRALVIGSVSFAAIALFVMPVYLKLQSHTFGAPAYSVERTMIPESDNTYDLGTSTKRWRNIETNNLTVNGTCTGCGGSSGGGDGVFTSSTNKAYMASTTQLLGIGTNSPSTTLHVIGSTTVTGQLNLGTFLDITASTLTAPAAGTTRLGAVTSNGFTRVQHMNEGTTPVIMGRDATTIVKNVSGGTLAIGTAVYVVGSTGAIPNVSSSQANATSTMPAIGVVLDAISKNSFGRIMTWGILDNVNTSAYASGDSLYLSTSTAGGFTNIRPTYPYLTQRIGSVLNSGVGNGSISIGIAPAVLGRESGTISPTFTMSGNLIFGDSSFFRNTAIRRLDSFEIEYPTSTVGFEKVIRLMPESTTTITKVKALNKNLGDSMVFNYLIGSDYSAATSTMNLVFTSYQTANTTSTIQSFTPSGSTTIPMGSFLMLDGATASTTRIVFELYGY